MNENALNTTAQIDFREQTCKWLVVIGVIAFHFLRQTSSGVFGPSLFAIIMAGTIAFGAWQLLHLTLFLFVMSTAPIFLPHVIWNLPALPFLVPFLLSVVVILPVTKIRNSLSWFTAGEINKVTWLLIFGTAAVSTTALIAWGFWTDNFGVAISMAKGFLVYPKWMILGLFVPVFALVNAFAEEVVYRGVIQEGLHQVFGEKNIG